MKTIKNIKDLQQGTVLVHFLGENCYYYLFLMIHPNNENYVLLIDNITKDAKKIYIPYIENSEFWGIDFTQIDIIKHKIEYHNKKIHQLEKRLENLEKNQDFKAL